MAQITPSQTIGPFFHDALDFERSAKLAGPQARGRRIQIRGELRDGSGGPVADALIEIWQADSAGRYHHPEDSREKPADFAFSGFGRAQTADDGSFAFETVKPGPVPGPDGRPQAPHLVLGVFARGVLNRLVTRVYFEDETANASDPILERVPAQRRASLLARRSGDDLYLFDVILQGPQETVFFDV